MPIACGEGLWYSTKDDGCKAGHLYTSSTLPSVSEGNYTLPNRRPGNIYSTIECPKGVSKYFEDPYDCAAYHFCNGGKDTVMLCEPGLYYHKGDYDHSPLCAFKPVCKDLLDGHYIDKYRPSCQFHYTCLDKRTHNYTACEYGYRFSEDKKQCLLAKNVKCS
ncbi:unnamed protein product, partial [Didymodactylos carnosus]